jgi:hypothetical protein
MKEQRTGLQKSISDIFAGATMPEEARSVLSHQDDLPHQAEEIPHEPPAIKRKRNKRKRARQTLRLAYSKAGV